MSDPSARVPVTLCWHCDRILDAATGMVEDEDQRPSRGAISLCLYCGAIAVFGPDLALLAPTEELLVELEKDPEFRRKFVGFNWARQFVMRRDNLMRRRDDPDR